MNKLNIFLLGLVLICAFAVILLQDEARKNYIELEQARSSAQKLNDEHTRLMLEQINLSKHMTIEVLAQQQGLHAPTVEELSILEP